MSAPGRGASRIFDRQVLRAPAALAVGVFVLVGVVGPLLAPHSPTEIHLDAVRQGFSRGYWLGTDHLGRDQLSRMLVAARVSLVTVGAVFVVALPFGVAVGAAAGGVGGIVDTVVLRATDVVVAVPGLLIGLLLSSVLGPGTVNVVLALAAATWAPYARLVRTEIRILRRQPLTESLVLLGVPSPRILSRHLVPAVLTPVVVLTSTEVAGTILAVSTLTFLGLGVRPPTPEWGTMIVEARPYLDSDPQLFGLPLLAIGAVVLAVNLLAEGSSRWATHGTPTPPTRAPGPAPPGDEVARPSPPRSADAPAPLLSVDQLTVTVTGPTGPQVVVDSLSFAVERGEVLALVGPSGSGKSLTIAALLGLLPDGTAAHAAGSARFAGQQLVGMPRTSLRALRGGRIGYVPQDPAVSLNPLWSVGAQIAESARLHRGMSRTDARQRAVELLAYVGVDDPRRVARLRPAQLSGGMCQRVLIAAVLAGEPDLILADEPTSALDAPVAVQVLQLLGRISDDTGLSLLVATHDIGVVTGLADHVVVLDHGTAVETGPVDEVLAAPTQPLTQAMVAALETRASNPTEPPGPTATATHRPAFAATARSSEVVLQVRDVDAVYPAHRIGQNGFQALSQVGVDVCAGRCLGVVGASGSGKSTLARLMVGLDRPHRGSVHVVGAPARAGHSPAQLVFQDTAAALDRRQTVRSVLTEAVRTTAATSPAAEQVAVLLRQVGLSPDLAGRRPWQLSGGQRQRVGIARALAARPRLLVLDEPVSALDVLVQSAILGLLDRLKAAGLTMVVISHDLAVVERLADELLVLDRGRAVEQGATTEVLLDPHHPVTQRLAEARPSPDPASQRHLIRPTTNATPNPLTEGPR